MRSLPKVIVTSVIRSVMQGESHGGMYLVDLDTSEFSQVVDWNDASISWEGRGLDRGLRGISFYQGHIYIAASDEVFVYNRDFKIVKSFRNCYLKHCHEIHVNGDYLFLTSTGFDSILIFDLAQEMFARGYCVRPNMATRTIGLTMFNPQEAGGPTPGDTLHINNVFYSEGKIIACGTGLQNLLIITDNRLMPGPPVPNGTHNAQLYRGGVLINDTVADRVALLDNRGNTLKSIPVIRYKDDDLLMSNVPKDHARQAFGRGLCIAGEGMIVGGSSPSTATLYDLENEKIVKSVNLTMDVRNSIHGLEIWPFD